MGTSSSRRTALAIGAICVASVAAIATTAYIVIPGGSGSATTAKTTVAKPLPNLKPMMLNTTEMGRMLGREMKTTKDGDILGEPVGSDYAVVPSGCSSLAINAEGTTYANIAWLSARRAEYVPVDQSTITPLVAAASIVLTASPNVAEKFLSDQVEQWQKCRNQTYHFGTRSVSQFVVGDVKALTDRVISQARQTDSAGYTCTHVMAIKEAYVVEAQSCGAPPADAPAMADKMLADIPD